jgi:hypothetical protein
MTSLDDLVTLVRAPAFALSEKSGSVDGGLCGVYVDDRRVLSRCVLTVGDRPVTPSAHQVPSADTATFLGVAGGVAGAVAGDVAVGWPAGWPVGWPVGCPGTCGSAGRGGCRRPG